MFNMDGYSKPCHIFLTGEKGIGKSALIDAITSSTDLKWEGIKSVSIVRDQKKYVYLTDAKKAEIKEENLIGICSEKGALQVFPQVFDAFGKELLKKAKDLQLFVIDEVGFMENQAVEYQKALSELLERTDLHVLGTLRMDEKAKLYKEVRENPNVKTFVIKEANRNNMAPVVNRLLHNIQRD